MLYISLIFISLGVFFIIYSIFTESNEKINLSGTDKTDSIEGRNEYSEGTAEIYGRGLTNFSDGSSDVESKGHESDLSDTGEPDELEEIVFNSDGKEVKSDTRKDEENNYAVLYEDSSGIFDYDTSTSIIDSTVNDYKMIKRIGKGKIEISKGGVNFVINKKFYRFDFHRVEDIKHGSNYIALLLKNSDIVRLFLFENDTTLGPRLKQRYRDFASATK